MTVVYLLFFLVVLPAVVGYCLGTEESDSSRVNLLRRHLHAFFGSELEPGDYLIYRKAKASPRPGPRARNVQPSEKGDDYYYEVDKYWTVSDVLDDGRLVAVTRTGKRVYLTPEDERLRKAGLLARALHRGRFPAV